MTTLRPNRKGTHYRSEPGPHSFRKMFRIVTGALLLIVACSGMAVAYLSSSTTQTLKTAFAASLPVAPNPTAAEATGSTVMVHLPVAYVSTGPTVTHYKLRRYTADATTVVSTENGSCLIAGGVASCSVIGVPDGSWRYSVIPYLDGTSWIGIESSLTISVVVDSVAPSVAISFPTTGVIYTPSTWMPVSGTVLDPLPTSGLRPTKVSLRQAGGPCFNGAAFSATCPFWLDAPSSAGTWSIAIPSAVLSDNDYVATVKAVDTLGNESPAVTRSFGYDSTAPVSSASQSPAVGATGWSTGAVDILFSASDVKSGVASTLYRLGSTSFAPVTGAVTIAGPGVYTIDYYSVDNVGNIEAIRSLNVRIDSVAPSTTDNSVTIGAGPFNATKTVELNASDELSGVSTTYYTTDGSTPTVTSSSGTSIALSVDGTYTVKYFSVDLAGNAEVVKKALISITIDKTRPTATVVSSGPSPTNAVIRNFSVHFSEPVTGLSPSGFTLTGTGSLGAAVSAVTGLGTDYNVSVVSGVDGAVILTLKDGAALDPAGNSNTSFAASAFVVDRTAPSASFAPVGSSPTNASSVAWTVTYSEPVIGVDLTDFALSLTGVTGATITSVTPVSPTTYGVIASTGTGDGTIKLQVPAGGAVDAAGNANLPAAPDAGFTIDRTAPLLFITAPLTGSVIGIAGTTIVGTCGTAPGDSATVTITITGPGPAVLTAACTAGGWSKVGAPPISGAYTISASQSDSVGNVTTTFVNVTADVVAPTVVSESFGSPSPTSAATITFSVRFSEPVRAPTLDPADFGTSLTGVAGAAITAVTSTADPLIYNVNVSVGPGSGTVLLTIAPGVTIADIAGNPLTSTTIGTTVVFIIDRAAPITTDNAVAIGAGPFRVNKTVTLSRSDPGGSGIAQTYFTVNGSTPTIASSTGASILLGVDGVFVIKYFSVDLAGNAEAVKTATVTITIDKTAPITNDNSSVIGPGPFNTSKTVTLTPTDPPSGLTTTYYTTDGTVPTIASAIGTSIVLSTDGTYAIRYFSVDVAGNIEPVKTAIVAIKIDKTAPAPVTLSAVVAPVTGVVTFSGSLGTAPGDISPPTVRYCPSASTTFAVGGALTCAVAPVILTPASATATFSMTTLSPSGTFTAQLSQADTAGNISYANKTFTRP
jgi:hypothetical protein